MDDQQGPTYNQGTLFNVMRQPEWERRLGENGYIYMYGWVPLLSTWNYHNIVNQLYPNIKLKVKKKTQNNKKILKEKHVKIKILLKTLLGCAANHQPGLSCQASSRTAASPAAWIIWASYSPSSFDLLICRVAVWVPALPTATGVLSFLIIIHRESQYMPWNTVKCWRM